MNYLRWLKIAPFLLENYDAIKADADAAIATGDDKVVVKYDAWTKVARWPVLGWSTVTGSALDACTTDAAAEAHVTKLFGDGSVGKLKDLFEKIAGNPFALALLRAWLKI